MTDRPTSTPAPISPISDTAPAIDALMAGRCIGVPTDTVYGIAARFEDPEAVRALFEVKGRVATKAMAVLVGDAEQAFALGQFGPLAQSLADRFWPGPLTIVVRRRVGVTIDLGGDASTIGVRCTDSELIRELIRAVGPIVTTSANLAGEPTLPSAERIAETFGARLGCVVDGGALTDRASTVVDVSGTGIVVLREGPITTAQLLSVA